MQHGKVSVTIFYQSFKSEEFYFYWNDGSGFSDQKYLKLKTNPGNQNYTFDVALNDSLKEIRFDPDKEFNISFIKEIQINGLKIPFVIKNFESAHTNGLHTYFNGDFCLLKRQNGNSDPYISFKIPDSHAALTTAYSNQDILVLCLSIVCTVFLTYNLRNFIQNLTLRYAFSKLALFSIFLFISCIYFLNLCLSFYETPKTTENRRMTERPGLDSMLHHPKRYFGTFTNWFNDQFPFKQLLVAANSRIKIDVFHTTPMPEKMYIGKNDQYFSGNELLTKDITGERRLNNDELLNLYATTLQKQLILSQQNISYYLTIPPSKQSIYVEDLPDILLLQLHGTKMLEQFSNEVKKNKAQFYIDIVSPLQLRHANYPNEKLFYQYDMHWSDWGAFLSYQILINRIASEHAWIKPALQINELKIDTIYENNADLARLILMQDRCLKERYEFSNDTLRAIEETIEDGVYTYPIYKYKNNYAKGKLLVFRDSYSEQWKWLIANHFNESIFVWDQNINQDLIDKYKPDIVIQENCEMFLFYLFQPYKK